MADADPIWWRAALPTTPEVVLFRKAFSAPAALTDAELSVFADTRYEIWLDGAPIGRGPARFSTATREYDIIALDALAPGPHLLAALVQWAPNTRRSESINPLLWAVVRGMGDSGPQIVARTDATWKAQPSPAWNPLAAPVHSEGLLGPTELLDLRRLPADWAGAGFDDSQWPAAIVTTLPPATYQPRTIPPLAFVPQAASVIDRGALSPDRWVGAVAPIPGQIVTIAANASAPTTLKLETVASASAAVTDSVTLDGLPLTWYRPPGRPPDIYAAQREAAAGAHAIAVRGQTYGRPLSVSMNNIPAAPMPLEQGAHAGQRLLLADLVPRAAAVTVATTPGLALAFNQPNSYAVIDTGRTVHGRITAQVEGPAGAIIDIGWDERLWDGRRPLPAPGSLHPQWNQADSWVLDGGRRDLTTIDSRSGRYILIAAWSQAPVRITNLQVIEERYPLVARGAFQVDDQQLNQIWQIGVDTLYPNMTDAYADPWRERGQWWGDAFVMDQINQAAFGDDKLVRRGLWLMAEAFQNGRPEALAPHGENSSIIDYGMAWLQSLRAYIQRSGDLAFLGQIYPAAIQFMDYLKTRTNEANGLIDMPVVPWAQGAYLDSTASIDRYGQSTALNALYYGTLNDAVFLADANGDAGNADRWRADAARVRREANALLFDEASGSYRTTILGGGAYVGSPRAQAMALAYGLEPAERTQDVADALLFQLDTYLPRVQIYGMHWVLRGLGQAGRISDGIAVIKRFYGPMIAQGATTWWEYFQANQNYAASLSHGWGGSPTWFLTRYVLGVERIAPLEWRLKPALGAVPRASGAYPLNGGALTVDWEYDCADGRIALGVPAASRGTVLIDDHPELVIRLNNQYMWLHGRAQSSNTRREGAAIAVDVTAGAQTLTVHRACNVIYAPLVVR